MNDIHVWTVYRRVEGGAIRWSVCRWAVDGAQMLRQFAVPATSLDNAREIIPIQQLGLFRFPASTDDDPSIVESWL